MLWIALIRRDKHISELILQLKLNILYYIILLIDKHFSHVRVLRQYYSMGDSDHKRSKKEQCKI